MSTMAQYRAKQNAGALLEALKNLLEDTQHVNHDCGGVDCPVIEARKLVAEIEGTRKKSPSGGG